MKGGPLPITTLRYQTTVELANAYATAAEEIGYNRRDFNMPFNGSGKDNCSIFVSDSTLIHVSNVWIPCLFSLFSF